MQAVDLAEVNPVAGTVYPAGDIDSFALAASPGPLHAELELPPSDIEGAYLAYRLLLLDDRMRPVATGGAVYDVNPSGAGFCQDATVCLTSSPLGVLEAEVPRSGVFYLQVAGGETDTGSNSITNSPSPYRLSVTYPRSAAVSGTLEAALFDADEFTFSVRVATFTRNLYAFHHARLLNHSLVPMPGTETDRCPSCFLTVLSTTSAPGELTGRLKILPGFDARYPAVGTVHLEVFGVNQSSRVVALGASAPISLTADEGGFTAFNNIFKPLRGERAAFRYALEKAGTVAIRVYTMDGLLVKTLLDGFVLPGKYSVDWGGENDSGRVVASGVYVALFDRPGTAGARATQKLVVIK